MRCLDGDGCVNRAGGSFLGGSLLPCFCGRASSASRSGGAHDGAESVGGALANGAELHLVEEGIQRVQVGGEGGVFEGDIQVEVIDELVEAAVAHHVIHVFAQRLALLAANLVTVVEHALQGAVLTEPLGGEAGAHAGHAGQVIGLLAGEGGQVGVHVRGHLGLLFDGGGVHSLNTLGGAGGDRIEQGDLVGDELEDVAVAGEDEDLVAGFGAAAGQGGDDIVSLVVFVGERGDVQRAEHLLDEVNLAVECFGDGVAAALVLAVFGGAEGATGQVEGDGDVAGLVVFDDAQQGGEEGVHSLGVLAVAAHEDVLAGLFGHGVDAEEGAQGQGVSVNEQEGVIRSSHPSSVSIPVPRVSARVTPAARGAGVVPHGGLPVRAGRVLPHI